MSVLTPQQAFDLAVQYHQSGHLEEAKAIYRRLLETDPRNANVTHLLGLAAHQSGELDLAIMLISKAISLNPASAVFYNNLGNALRDQARLEESVQAYRRAIQLAPTSAEPYSNLGAALKAQGQIEEAMESYRHALRLNPNLPEACSNLGDSLQQLGCLDEAISLFERAIQMPGHIPGMYDNYLATLHYSPRITPEQLREAHRQYDVRYAQALRAAWRPHENSRDPDRPIRLGFVSPHFGLHPVGRFLVRLLENLSRRDFIVTCYSDTPVSDSMKERLRANASEWQEVNSFSHERLAAQVRDDRIDIFFDLAGHTPGNRLLTFAQKPAPIQVTWLDYVGTVGLSAIDYLLADPRQIPPEAEPYYCETVLRMPDDYICFDPPADAPPVGPLPAERHGFICFGSFNLLTKTTSQILDVWCAILQQVPDSRLVLQNHAFDHPRTVQRLREHFGKHSIDFARITLLGRSPHAELLAAYHEVDIALDTYPYNGGLTTCEALWMGVPVVTCPGQTFASRHGLAHLTAAGFTETIANDLSAYVQIAVGLAQDRSRLATLRSELRPRLAASALCDGRRFADHFGRTFRDVWRKWCGSMPSR